jgi:hypothetical protein
MDRRTAIATLSLALLALPATAAAAPTAGTSLTIRVFDRPVPAPPSHVYHLRCGPASGNVPHPAIACRHLLAASRPLAALPTCLTVDVIDAAVTGTFRGRRVQLTYLPCAADAAAWKRLTTLLGIPVR